MKQLNFDGFGLSEELQQAIDEMGFVTATPIQSETIPLLLNGQDVIGQAQTGTGKTAAFAIPALEKLDKNSTAVQVLVLCPTRELALQVSQEFKKLSKYKKGVYVVPIYGGESIDKQFKQLKRGVQVVVGTPGRVIDHIERGTLRLNEVHQIILDEADEMLNMGFKEDIERILQELPQERHTVFFSATMPKPILELTKKYQNHPQLVKVTSDEVTNQNIEQAYFHIREDQKLSLMLRLLEYYQLNSMLVFCNTKQKVSELQVLLEQYGILAETLHGDLTQAQRNNAMGKFRNGRVKMLIATDVAARGIDVSNVEAVFNYDTPLDPEYYVHRIGRTGRAGKKGLSFTFVAGRDMRLLKEIERFANIRIEKGKVPTVSEIREQRENNFLEQIKNRIDITEKPSLMHSLEKLEAQGFTTQQVALTLMKMYAELTHSELNHENIEQLESKGDQENKDKGKKKDQGRKKEGFQKSDFKSKFGKQKSGIMTRLFLNLGKKQKVSKSDIVGAIAGDANINGKSLGVIDLYDHFAFVELPKQEAELLLKMGDKIKIKGKKVNFEVARQE